MRIIYRIDDNITTGLSIGLPIAKDDVNEDKSEVCGTR